MISCVARCDVQKQQKENNKMKKLMLTMAVVLAAAMTQAAMVDWKVSAGPNANRLFNMAGTGAYRGTVYFVLAANESNIINAMKADESWSSYVVDSTTALNATTGGMSAFDRTPDTLTSAEQSFKILLVENDGTADWYKFSNAKSMTPQADPDNTPAQLTFTASTDFGTAGAGWTKVEAVPEPTSAMLLLLGVAGLALRRRRA